MNHVRPEALHTDDVGLHMESRVSPEVLAELLRDIERANCGTAEQSGAAEGYCGSSGQDVGRGEGADSGNVGEA